MIKRGIPYSVSYDTTMKTKVIIYSRPGCHLCEEAKTAMRAAGCEDQYELDEVNIENEPELLELYKDDIPVITLNGVEAFRHRVKSVEFGKAVCGRRRR
ncbi:glutaredoxin family protein [soil metagenome]